MVTAKHAEHVIRTRAEMAQRWHGLRSEADILQFVLADPEVRALDLEVDEATRRQNALVFIRRVECALASGVMPSCSTWRRTLAAMRLTASSSSLRRDDMARLTLQQRAFLLGLRRVPGAGSSRARAS